MFHEKGNSLDVAFALGKSMYYFANFCEVAKEEP